MFNKLVEYFTHKDRDLRDNRRIFISILAGAVVGLLAAFVLSVDAIEILKDPYVSLSCNINTIISCGTVAQTSYASMFGFPNSFIGLMVEPIFVTFAVAALFGTKFNRKFMFGLQAISIGAILFTYYLLFISVYSIHALCPWCITVDVATTVIFFAVTRYNIKERNLYLSHNLNKIAQRFVKKNYDILAGATLIVLQVAIIIVEFGNSLFS